LKAPLISLALVVGLFVPPLHAQQPTLPLMYVESFRQGTTHIVEDHFDVKLSPQDSTFRERIKDTHGTDRYVFSIEPLGPLGDTKITSWQAKLVDLQHKLFDNVLLASQVPSDDPDDPKDAVTRLDPSKFAKVPSGTKRIIKVDSFYVMLQVNSFHHTPADSPYLDSMSVSVAFSNSDPRSAEEDKK
jgi:hypothetical protein